ncbi:MAG TPA: glycoside hydrolase family 9 protein [Steroidobacteraceae bacterium]|nr:glycoside hydrolase family 9 protein [Steroidobacteraceae bacterium]
MHKFKTLTATLMVSAAIAAAQAEDNFIHVNQLGYLPAAHKVAVVPAGDVSNFEIIKAGTNTVALRGKLGAAATWEPSAESVRLADFTALKQSGEYQIRVKGLPDSDHFTIAADEYAAINQAAIKYYYLNRASMEIDAKYAGKYARAAGHPDDHVLVHASAATTTRPEGTVISSPKGWYDAGDYNKYIVNSGITTYTLLAAYEHFPQFYKKQSLNIPESGDKIPDLLNEVMWNLEWMLTMQDEDGGLYHKLTNKLFDPFVMPDKSTKERYVVQKTTAATLDFAAVMATASRIYKEYDTTYPGFSARALKAAERAWQWAQANPSVVYQQPADVKTGGYDDNNVSDEFAWAAAELYITTKNDDYYRALHLPNVLNVVPSWGGVSGLAWMSLAQHRKNLTATADQALIETRVDQLANILLSKSEKSAYNVAMTTHDFVWGSNAVAMNQAMMLIQGYRLNGTRAYLDAAQSLFDYVVGRNPTGYSFVTGFGHKPSMHPHHRISEADGIVDPVPGMLIGGATSLQVDSKGCKQSYPSKLPAKSYLDDICSYTTNEIAINWNAPLVYVSGALQVLTK